MRFPSIPALMISSSDAWKTPACFSSSRRPWFPKFRAALGATRSLAGIERLLCVNVEKWRSRPPRYAHHASLGGHPETLSEDDVDREAEPEEDHLRPGLNLEL